MLIIEDGVKYGYSEIFKNKIQIGYNLVDLKSSPLLFQKFLESVPDFFIERQGAPAGSNEAKNIISNLPPSVSESEKLLFGIKYENNIIGFFEILLHFPSQKLVAHETKIIQEKLGKLTANRFTIGFLVIHSDHRNRGLGTNIMSIIEKILMDAGYEYSHLIVNQNNENAKRFYERHGYQVVKETKQNIGGKVQNCFIMIKELKNIM